MNIRDAMSEIAKVQEGLRIGSPRVVDMARAYKLPPARDKALSDFPCIINTVRLEPTVFGASLLKRTYRVTMQFFAGRGPEDEMADVTLAFEDALVRAFREPDNVILSGTVTNVATIEGVLARMEWANQGFIGFDYQMVIHMAEAA